MKTRREILFLGGAILTAGCSPSGPAFPLPAAPLRASLDLKRGPYVQMGGTDSILVVWQTFSPTQGAVEFGLTDSLGARIESNVFGTTHSASLTGLQPNTYYYYRVLDRDRALSRVVRFHTNHAPTDTSFTFLVVGDSGSGAESMTHVADMINGSGASFGLHTGDVIYMNGEEHFYDSRFFYPYSQFLATNVMYMCLGNHDMKTDDGAPYLSSFYLPANNFAGTKRYYSFDYGNAHFVALDTNQHTGIGGAQRAWLEQDLATSTKLWKFVFFHHPPYSAGVSIEGDKHFILENTDIRRDLVRLFEIYGVNIVFSGHAHSYERTYPILRNQAMHQEQEPNYADPSGPVYVVTGGGGGGLTSLNSSSLNARAIAAYHFVEISISDKQLSGRAIGLSGPWASGRGAAIDEFSLAQR